MDLPAAGHDPVLMAPVLEFLQPRAGMTLIDCTLGRAGHAAELAKHLGPTGLLIGLDVDPRNLEFAKARLAEQARIAPCAPCRLFHANFSELWDVLDEVGIQKVDGIFADLGISTNQLFESQYGMSFTVDMPLDMRIDPRSSLTAAHIVNTYDEEDLANVLYKLAQERLSRRIARKIGEQRRISPINTTERLAEIVRSVYGWTSEKIDAATRTFLALRMAVNQELENLESLLKSGPGFLKPGGRLAVISFQSMEDRLVKQAFRSLAPTGAVRILTNRPIGPTDDEIALNPRSRSAKMRVIEKC